MDHSFSRKAFYFILDLFDSHICNFSKKNIKMSWNACLPSPLVHPPDLSLRCVVINDDGRMRDPVGMFFEEKLQREGGYVYAGQPLVVRVKGQLAGRPTIVVPPGHGAPRSGSSRGLGVCL